MEKFRSRFLALAREFAISNGADPEVWSMEQEFLEGVDELIEEIVADVPKNPLLP
jgi:hypothetical protein